MVVKHNVGCKEALVQACRMIAGRMGSCPVDLLDVEPWDEPCETFCKTDQRYDECWGRFFLFGDKDEF